MTTARCNQPQTALQLIEDDRVDPNLGIHSGSSPLMIASFRGFINVLKVYLKSDKVQVNYQRPRDGVSALYFACQNGYGNIIRSMCRVRDVDININRDGGYTPLIAACSAGHAECVRELVNTGLELDVNSRRADGSTAMHIAASGGHILCVQQLLKHEDANVNIRREHYGTTPLMLASQQGHLHVVKFMLEQSDVDVRLEDAWGTTAIEYAKSQGHNAIAELLITDVWG